ncbi:hypothetical protein SAMN06265827_105103 [Orenia metallireducens]|uniref:Phage transcriptional regulator, RinA family n=1 Tax=Orenia metallireducens TaxID=1413210 RepID=A0A285G7K3_9FIRM|nr:hypothetical protein [Orenia metallireducens]SNY19343.1 hypothetical protein SAMN06265827_105103 [Orenia metallireducens]
MSIKKKMEQQVEKILINYNLLKTAREVARQISQEEYSQKGTSYSVTNAKTNEIHSEVEEYCTNKTVASLDAVRIEKIINKIDEVLEKELSDRERIVIENFLIRDLDIQEVNDRLDAYCNQVLGRTTIYRFKKKGLNKFVAKGIAKYVDEINGYLEEYL